MVYPESISLDWANTLAYFVTVHYESERGTILEGSSLTRKTLV